MAKVNFPANEKANVTRPCLVAACRGNENIADLLNYLIYEAQDTAEKMKVEGNDIPLQLTHDKMLNRPRNEGKRFNFSERSLIGYLRLLDEWKLVTNGKYDRSHVVHINAINKAIANPPEKPKGKPRGKRKSCNVEENKPATKASTLLSQENVELKLKVEMLQENVEKLQLKVEMFQLFVETFQLSKSSNGAQEASAEAKIAALYSVDTVYSVDFFTGATFRSDDDDLTGPSPDKKNSYSQEDKQPTPEKKDDALLAAQQRIAELEQQLLASQADSSRLQEKHNNQSNNPTLFQETVPAESAAPKVVFPDMTKDLQQRDVRQPLTAAEQRRQDAAEERHKTKMAARREQEIWEHYASLLETPVSQIIRDDFSKRAVKALIEGNATNEAITLTFNHLKSKKLTTTLAFISSNLNSVVSTQKPQPKPKSELLDMTHWTDEDWDTYRRTGNVPEYARRA